MLEYLPATSVVVGIDGSQAAVRAARWAAEKVAGSNIPLRLLYVREQNHTGKQALATAERALHEASSAVATLGKPVKVETQIVSGSPAPVLIEASGAGALLCVGGTGTTHPESDGVGVTAAELAQSAACSVAVIRSRGNAPVGDGRSIVALVSESAENSDVLQMAFQEAQRLNAPLAVISAWESGFNDLQDDRIIDERDRQARTALDRDVAAWMPRYPEVKVQAIAAYGTFLNYLTEHAKTTGWVVISGAHTGQVRQLVGPAGAHALRSSDFSVLVVRRRDHQIGGRYG
ncbi:universal stress protein [Mycobacterium sp. SM1]|uniref:universal stress protein n=1 Tax=Mycobacterium sp. SM1 TaxID=2816243 RepID=UPI001F1F1F66|nr:universal stress protein [Mycobacterium sp. SM1]